MRLRHVSALVALCLFASVAGAQVCGVGIPVYRVAINSACQWKGSKAEACASAAVTNCVLMAGSTAYTSATVTLQSESVCRGTRVRASDGAVLNWSGSYGASTGTIPCPEPEACENEVESVSVVGTSVPAVACNPISNCKMVRGSGVCIGESCIFSVRHTTEDCASPSDPEVEAGDGSEECASGGGLEFCKSAASPLGENCGFVNGDFVCLERVEDDGCVAGSDGGRLCGAAAPMPPVPDNGTAGIPAEPDAVMAVNESTTMNYYSSSTVSGASRPLTGSGDNPYDGDDGDPQGGDSEGEDDGVREGLMCDPLDDSCTETGNEGEGDDPRGGWQCWADGDGLSGAVAACFAEAADSMWDAISTESELIAIANATAAAFPSSGGVCPTAEVELSGETFDFWEVPCMFLDDVDAVLGPLFLLFWSFLGLRILLTIPGGD